MFLNGIMYSHSSASCVVYSCATQNIINIKSQDPSTGSKVISPGTQPATLFVLWTRGVQSERRRTITEFSVGRCESSPPSKPPQSSEFNVQLLDVTSRLMIVGVSELKIMFIHKIGAVNASWSYTFQLDGQQVFFSFLSWPLHPS